MLAFEDGKLTRPYNLENVVWMSGNRFIAEVVYCDDSRYTLKFKKVGRSDGGVWESIESPFLSPIIYRKRRSTEKYIDSIRCYVNDSFYEKLMLMVRGK